MLTLPTVATTHMSNAIVYIVFFNVLKNNTSNYSVHNVMFLHNVSYLIKPLHFKLNSFVLQIPINCL